MRYAAFLALFAAGTILFMAQDASAQLSANKAYSLIGSGFATSNDSIVNTDVDLAFVITKVQNTVGFDLQSGTIKINDDELNISDFSASTSNNGKIFKFTSSASATGGEKFSIKATGRLVDKTATDSIYSLSATLTDSNKATTKLVYTTKIAEYTPKAQTPKSGITIKILKGSSDPSAATYKDFQAGFQFRYFSEDRLTVKSGQTITFVNEDTAPHSLKSGIANSPASTKKTFKPDGRFASGKIAPGKTWSVTLTEPGLYRFYDENNQWMDITVFVANISSYQPIKSNKPLN